MHKLQAWLLRVKGVLRGTHATAVRSAKEIKVLLCTSQSSAQNLYCVSRILLGKQELNHFHLIVLCSVVKG